MTEISSDSFTVFLHVCDALREAHVLEKAPEHAHPAMRQAAHGLAQAAISLARAKIGSPDAPTLSSHAGLEEWFSLATMTGNLELVETFPLRKPCSVPRSGATSWSDVRDRATSAYLIACMRRGLDVSLSERVLMLRALREQDHPLQEALYKTLASRANPESWLPDAPSDLLAENSRYVAKYLRWWVRWNPSNAARALGFSAEQGAGRSYAILRLSGANHEQAMTDFGYGQKLLPAITNHEWLALCGGATTAEQYLSQPQLHERSAARFMTLVRAVFDQ